MDFAKIASAPTTITVAAGGMMSTSCCRFCDRFAFHATNVAGPRLTPHRPRDVTVDLTIDHLDHILQIRPENADQHRTPADLILIDIWPMARWDDGVRQGASGASGPHPIHAQRSRLSAR